MRRIQSCVRLLALAMCSGSMLLFGGCSTLSGVGGEPRYACQAPTGAQCTSVSGIYANTGRQIAASHAATGLLTRESPQQSGLNHQAASPLQRGATAAPVSLSGTPTASESNQPTLRSPPRLLRLWIAPWEDSDGDLHEASTVHMVADIGRWQIDRVRSASRRTVLATPPARPKVTAPGTSPKPAPRAADELIPIPPSSLED